GRRERARSFVDDARTDRGDQGRGRCEKRIDRSTGNFTISLGTLRLRPRSAGGVPGAYRGKHRSDAGRGLSIFDSRARDPPLQHAVEPAGVTSPPPAAAMPLARPARATARSAESPCAEARRAQARRTRLLHSRGIALLVVLVSMLILTLAAASLVRKALATASASGMIAVRYNLALAGLSAVEAGASIAAGGAAAPDLDVDAPSANYYAWRQPGEDARGVPAALQTRDAFPPGARVLTAG